MSLTAMAMDKSSTFNPPVSVRKAIALVISSNYSLVRTILTGSIFSGLRH